MAEAGADSEGLAPARSWPTLSLRVPDPLLKDALIGEFSGDAFAGVWERSESPDGLDLIFYFDSARVPPLAEARIRRIFERNGHAAPRVRQGEEGSVDWSLGWRKGFTAFGIGTRFRVVPSWEDPPEGDTRFALRIDPGMAFGTGTHETTRTVLEMLETFPSVPVTLDVGAGSGILSIAAFRMGGKRVLACEVDFDAVEVARENYRRNHSSVGLVHGSVDAIRSASVGLVLANLTADVIRELAHEVRRVLHKGGHAIWSGILNTQREEMETFLEDAGFRAEARVECGEWVSWHTRSHGG